MLAYKCRNDGIEYFDQEEAHTSKTSFLDNEDICHHGVYAGKRVKRGLFVSAKGVRMNADQNGAYNILRKKGRQRCFLTLTDVNTHKIHDRNYGYG